MARLPVPGSDNGAWGDILNDYLLQTHDGDGSLKSNVVTSSALAVDAVDATHIANGSITEALLDSGVQTKINNPDWDNLQNKPAVIASGADEAAARSAIGFDDGLATTTAHLPRVYLDPRYMADGPLTQMSKGQFDLSFGNNVMGLSGGKVTHVQGAGGAGNNAGYLQALLPNQITRLGCVAYWPSGATGVVALVIPSARWNYPGAPGLSDAPVHLTLDGAGQMTMGRFDKTGGIILDGRSARVRGFTTGASHSVEVFLIASENRVVVTVDRQRYLNFVDADFFANQTNYAIWELFEANNSTIPAQLLAVWADDRADIIPPSAAPELAHSLPPALLDSIGGVTDSTTTSFTTTLTATYEDITILPTFSFQYPESGKVLVRINAWVSVSGGDLLLRANNTAGARIASSGFNGRITHEQILTGTPGLNTGTTMTWQAYMTAGTTTFQKGGAYGPITVSAIPLRY